MATCFSIPRWIVGLEPLSWQTWPQWQRQVSVSPDGSSVWNLGVLLQSAPAYIVSVSPDGSSVWNSDAARSNIFRLTFQYPQMDRRFGTLVFDPHASPDKVSVSPDGSSVWNRARHCAYPQRQAFQYPQMDRRFGTALKLAPARERARFSIPRWIVGLEQNSSKMLLWNEKVSVSPDGSSVWNPKKQSCLDLKLLSFSIPRWIVGLELSSAHLRIRQQSVSVSPDGSSVWNLI